MCASWNQTYVAMILTVSSKVGSNHRQTSKLALSTGVGLQ